MTFPNEKLIIKITGYTLLLVFSLVVMFLSIYYKTPVSQSDPEPVPIFLDNAFPLTTSTPNYYGFQYYDMKITTGQVTIDYPDFQFISFDSSVKNMNLVISNNWTVGTPFYVLVKDDIFLQIMSDFDKTTTVTYFRFKSVGGGISEFNMNLDNSKIYIFYLFVDDDSYKYVYVNFYNL